MANASSVGELVLRWQELRAKGRAVSAEELCAGCPEQLDDLRGRIEALASMEQFLGATAGGDTPPPEYPQAIPLNSTKQADGERFDFLTAPQGPDEMGRLGTYRILKVLGIGGMGIVFLAEDMQLKRQVALKVMKPEMAGSQTARERFLREARAAAAMEDQHIVTIYQVGEACGVPFLAMQWLKGLSLEERLRRPGRLNMAQVLRLGRQVASGLATAHQHGLIHRDIKPANLWIEPERGGRIKILDFGLARAAADDTHLTQSGAIVGTPAYMAPEQARGQTVTAACDLFGLGVVLYQMCTGTLPFRGDNTLAILASLATDQPRPVRDLNAAVPSALADLVMQLLNKEPARRPQSAVDVADRLQAIERTFSEAAPSSRTEILPFASVAGAPARDGGRMRRRRTLAVAAPMVLLLPLLVLLPLSYFFGGQIIRVATNRGQIVIEVDDPKTEVVIKENGVVIQDGPGRREITVKAGVHDLDVSITDAAGKTQFLTKKLTLSRGGKEIVNVRQELAQAKPPEQKADNPSAPQPDGDAERQAAEWVLSIGGAVGIMQVERQTTIRNVKELPPAKFRFRSVWLGGNKHVNDAGLVHLKPLTNLTALDLEKTQVSDAGLEHLKPLTNLTVLNLRKTKVTDAGLVHLKPFTNLAYLWLTGSAEVSDAGLVHLKAFPDLTSLQLGFSKVSDAGMVHLKALTNLTELDLHSTKVSDAGLEQLKPLTHLTALGLNNTKVSDAGLDHLKAFPKLTSLGLGGSQVSDAGLEQIKMLPQLTTLNLDGSAKVSDAGLVHLKALTKLTNLGLNGSQVSDAGLEQLKPLTHLTALSLYYTKVSDAGLVHLKALTNLTSLALGGPNVTDAGLVHLKALTQLTYLNLQETKVSNNGLVHLKPLTKLTTLDLNSTAVSDAGLKNLYGLKNLQKLNVNLTKVTVAGVADLRKALPQCDVYAPDALE
jgi:eukaryotic-like serine/threonine-protein kinase